MTSNFNKKYDLILAQEFSYNYQSELKDDYSFREADIEEYSQYFDRAKAIEIDEYSANALLDSGLGVRFIPSYTVKPVIVKTNNTTTNLSSLDELENSDVKVNIVLDSDLTTRFVYLSISKSISDKFDLDTTIKYIKKM